MLPMYRITLLALRLAAPHGRVQHHNVELLGVLVLPRYVLYLCPVRQYLHSQLSCPRHRRS